MPQYLYWPHGQLIEIWRMRPINAIITLDVRAKKLGLGHFDPIQLRLSHSAVYSIQANRLAASIPQHRYTHHTHAACAHHTCLCSFFFVQLCCSCGVAEHRIHMRRSVSFRNYIVVDRKMHPQHTRRNTFTITWKILLSLSFMQSIQLDAMRRINYAFHVPNEWSNRTRIAQSIAGVSVNGIHHSGATYLYHHIINW